jgi:uncharacterized peroxidase-related enzyme
MAHIQVREDLPGIRGLMVFRPETAEPLNQLADVLLRGANSLSPGERELIATLVSSLNDCFFCQTVHGAVAACHLDNNEQLVRDVKTDPEHAAVSEKLKALLAIAGKVQRSGKEVTSEDIARARSRGATDMEIHDAVLIAAAFCMFNRYVDGLGTWAPTDLDIYRQRAPITARDGYANSIQRILTETGKGD